MWASERGEQGKHREVCAELYFVERDSRTLMQVVPPVRMELAGTPFMMAIAPLFMKKIPDPRSS